jgi:hypothetical protein
MESTMNRLTTWMVAACAAAFSAAGLAQSATDVACTGCVGETDLANQAVTSAKIANGTIATADIKPSAVTSDKIKNQTIVMADLSLALRDVLGSGIANLTVQRVSASGASVAGAECPSDRIPVSASCECDDANGARNLGVLFSCTTSGTGAVSACFEEARSFNPTKAVPLAIVRAICLGATTADGTPWVPTSTGLAADAGGADAAAEGAAAQAAWAKEQHATFDAALAKLRAQGERQAQ